MRVLVQGLQFSADGKFLALAERRDCKDFISLFDCNTWQLIKVSSHCFCTLFLFRIVFYIDKWSVSVCWIFTQDAGSSYAY